MTKDSTSKAREDRARRALALIGYRMKKTPARSSLRRYFPLGYMVLPEYSNTVTIGASNREYEATIEDVEWFVASKSARQA